MVRSWHWTAGAVLALTAWLAATGAAAQGSDPAHGAEDALRNAQEQEQEQARSEREQKRQAIGQERAKANAALDAQALACQGQFAVSACAREVELQRKTMTSRLNREEAVLNDQDRQQRARDQRQSTRDKLRERAAQDAQRSDGRAEQQASDKRDEQGRKQAVQATALQRAPAASTPRLASGLSDAEQARNRQVYADKMEAARKHREELARRQREKPSTARPLPLDPPKP